MGHQRHPLPFNKGGANIGDHPHFHRIKYYRDRYSGAREPGKTHDFSPLLFVGMESRQFLLAFLKNFYFDHLDDDEILLLNSKNEPFQSKLERFIEGEGTK
jgi:hypothetical protein